MAFEDEDDEEEVVVAATPDDDEDDDDRFLPLAKVIEWLIGKLEAMGKALTEWNRSGSEHLPFVSFTSFSSSSAEEVELEVAASMAAIRLNF